ncbi:hypothetical protein [Kitasatospora viridis]|uniref:Uncharacterized protein n=1 Tax=Kitasatospora viridis TaxID=281105 RepID=A0A561UJ65_9ACTN|nr:hypothetical protein [Kitasatospora viridis]TWF99418.1 hypothetical protein FHX73_113262 [Kitasatospora viridis]
MTQTHRQNAGLVPYITAWSSERTIRPELLSLSGRGLGFERETPHDRDADGVLWSRMTSAAHQGSPDHGRVHPQRQRRAMRRLLCQVCGGPADRTDEGVLWLLRDDRDDWPDWPEGMAATHPPVCLPCARAATRLCPHLRRRSVAVRVREYETCGVYGSLYRPGLLGLEAVGDVVVASTEPLARWVLAAQMVRVLRGCSLVRPDVR